MKRFVFVTALILSLLVTLALGVRAQERQVGGGFQFKNYDASTNVDNPTKGFFVDTYIPFGNISLNGRFSYDRFDAKYPAFKEAAENKVYNYRADVRYNGWAYNDWKIFASAGFDAKEVNAEVEETYYSINYFSPTVGAGANFKGRAVIHYFYAFRDFTSGVEERGHHLRADGYIPISEYWRVRLGLEYSDLTNGFGRNKANLKNVETSFGIARTF